MNKLLACLVAVAAISMTANESQAQCYRGGSGFSIGVGNGFNSGFGFNNFNRGYGRSVGGLSISVGNGGFGGFGVPYGGINRGFYGGGVPYYAARPAYVAPVYRGGFYGGGGGVYRGGGFYGGGRGCGGW